MVHTSTGIDWTQARKYTCLNIPLSTRSAVEKNSKMMMSKTIRELIKADHTETSVPLESFSIG
jgi:hypothetical protein